MSPHYIESSLGDGSSVSSHGSDEPEGIAIVGFDLCFPQDGDTPAGFWRMMEERRGAMTEFPADRLNTDSFYDPQGRPGTLPMRGGHFIKGDISAFDAEFFAIAPSEAQSLDPQSRMLLETAYRALENAGIRIEDLRGSNTSVTTGSFTNDYFTNALKDVEDAPASMAVGSTLSMLANRLSWFFDLRGPSMNIDGACASSAMAVQTACEQLRRGDCDLAIVAASNLILDPDFTVALGNMNFTSPDSRSFTFDKRANGYARGEGIGVVILQRANDAVQKNNCMRAVIRAARSNQNGLTPGITQPSGPAQYQLIEETYRKAGLSMSHTRFCEAHGTGTILGDVAEANAIIETFMPYRNSRDPLYIGAVKSCIGHLEGASGLAALLKTVMILEKGLIVPNANFETINPQIYNSRACAVFPQTVYRWPDCQIRRASISSFGYGGSNCHMIVDDAYSYLQARGWSGHHNTSTEGLLPLQPQRTLQPLDTRELAGSQHDVRRPLLWSAKSEESLREIIKSWVAYANDNSSSAEDSFTLLSNISYTLADRRSCFPWRASAVVEDIQILKQLDLSSLQPIQSRGPPSIGFVFTGQGAQWYAMGRELLQYETFASHIAQCTDLLYNEGCPWSVRGKSCFRLLGKFRRSTDKRIDELNRSDSASNVNDPALAQPLTAIIQIGLIKLLRKANVRPVAVVGHSMGEIAAAYSIGLFDENNAVKLAYYRGVYVATINQRDEVQGGMLAAGLGPEQLQKYFGRIKTPSKKYALISSCLNSPTNTTVSGEVEQLDELRCLLEADGIFARRLRVSAAYHSAQIEVIGPDCLRAFNTVKFSQEPLTGIMISTVTGRPIDRKEIAHGGYWVRNMISPVAFTEAISHLCQQASPWAAKKLDGSHRTTAFVDTLIEIGPHAALALPIKQILNHLALGREVHYMSLLYRNKPADKKLLEVLTRLWSVGTQVSFSDLRRLVPRDMQHSKNRHKSRLVTDGPGFVFNHKRSFWHEGPISRQYRLKPHGPVTLLGQRMREWRSFCPEWRQKISATHLPWLAEHQINGTILYPAAAMILTAIKAVKQLSTSPADIKSFLLRRVRCHTPIIIRTLDSVVDTRSTLTHPDTDSPITEPVFSIYSKKGDEWQLAFSCTIKAILDDDSSLSWRELTYRAEHDQDVSTCDQSVDASTFYQRLNIQGFGYYNSFQSIRHASYNDSGRVTATVDCTPRAQEPESPLDHLSALEPGSLDSIFQVAFVALSKGGSENLTGYVVDSIERLWVNNACQPDPSSNMDVSARIHSSTPRECNGDVFALQTHCHTLFTAAEGFKVVAMASLEAKSHAEDGIGPCFSVQEVAELSLSTPPATLNLLEAELGEDAIGPQLRHAKVRLFVLQVLQFYNTEARQLAIPSAKPHLRKYLAWVQEQLETNIDHEQPALRRPMIESVSEAEKPAIAMFQHVADNFLRILRDDNAAEVLFQGGLMPKFYASQSVGSKYYEKIVNYLRHAATINTEMSVLEVGAGTGSFTEHVLSAFRESESHDPMRLGSYTFSDVSASFFGEAREKFEWCSQYMKYKVLDINQDFGQQGHQQKSYDLIVASNVLHLCQNLEKSLRSLRSLLRPGGRLILHENTRPEKVETTFIFGTTPGWWSATGTVPSSGPLLSSQDWDKALKKSGFSGAEVVIPDFIDEECHTMDIIVTAAVEPLEFEALQNGVAFLAFPDTTQNQLADSLAEEIRHSVGRNVCCRKYMLPDTIADIQPSSVLIVLADVCRRLFSQLTPSQFTVLHNALSNTEKVLWITKADPCTENKFDDRSAEGFLRVFGMENPTKAMTILRLDSADDNCSALTPSVLSILGKLLNKDCGLEMSYRLEKGRCLVDRVNRDEQARTGITTCLTGLTAVDKQLAHCRPFVVSASNHLSQAGFAINHDSDNMLTGTVDAANGPTVEIQVSHVGYSSISSSQFPQRMSYSGLQDERPVCLFADKDLRSTIRAPQSSIINLPDHVSTQQAAATVDDCFLALHVSDICRFSATDRVMLCGPSSFFKYALLVLAHDAGSLVYVTVESLDEERWVEANFFPERIRTAHSQDIIGRYRRNVSKPANCIIDIDGALSLSDLSLYVAPFARLVDCNLSAPSRPNIPVVDNLTICRLNRDVLQQSDYHQDIGKVQSVFDAVWNLNPSVPKSREIHLTEILNDSELIRLQPVNEKTTIDLTGYGVVKCYEPVASKWQFKQNGTYVVAGGFGDLGRHVLRWVVDRGARNIIVLSRKGPRGVPAQKLMDELRERGINVVAPICDISDSVTLAATMDHCARVLPPVRGCFQLSGAVKDTLYDKMSFEDWQAAVGPKIHGSWNLHNNLPGDMDFFILSSSITGILGQATQINYATGNMFQDSLARYRASVGMKTVSLDLGLLLTGGMLTEDPDLLGRLLRTGHWDPITESQVIALFDHYCNPETKVLNASSAQIIVGVRDPTDITSRGYELLDSLRKPAWSLLRPSQQFPLDLTGSSQQSNDGTLSLLLQSAESMTEITEIVLEKLIHRLSQTLSVPEANIVPEQAISAYGADSLTAVDLTSWIFKKVGVNLPVFDILGDTSFKEAATLIAYMWKKEHGGSSGR